MTRGRPRQPWLPELLLPLVLLVTGGCGGEERISDEGSRALQEKVAQVRARAVLRDADGAAASLSELRSAGAANLGAITTTTTTSPPPIDDKDNDDDDDDGDDDEKGRGKGRKDDD